MPAQPTAKVSKSAISVINENGKLGSIHFRTEMGGPPHQPTFVVKAVMGGRLIGTGQATTKKKAKEIAAEAALESLKLQWRHRSAHHNAPAISVCGPSRVLPQSTPACVGRGEESIPSQSTSRLSRPSAVAMGRRW